MFPPQPPMYPTNIAPYGQPQQQYGYPESNHQGAVTAGESMSNNIHYQHQTAPPMPPMQPPVDKFASMTLNSQPNPDGYANRFDGNAPIQPYPQYQPQTGQPLSYQPTAAQPVMAPPPPPAPPMPPMPTSIANNLPVQHSTVPDAGVPGTTPPAPNYPPYQQDRYGGHPYTPGTQPGYPGVPPSGPPQPSRRISAEGLPSAVEVIENNRTQYPGPFLTGQRSVLPPLVTTDFSCRDEGNCNPRFIRSSLYAVPVSSDMLKTIGIPFTLTISPFAALHPEDQCIMISDMGPQGPVRCVRCKGYMNPFVSFIDGGRRFQCPLCNALTDVPTEYFAHLDHTGRRTDAFSRPELCVGSYELMATAEYCKNNQLPLPPAFIFVLDVSQTSLRSGLVGLFCSQFVNRILPKLPKEEYEPEGSVSPVRLGFITYDHQIHFYTLTREDSSSEANNTDQAQNGPPEEIKPQIQTFARPQMNIVADVEDVFVPTVEGFLLPPDPSVVSSILSLIPTQFGTDVTPATPDALLGPAIQAGLEALRAANRPGKLFVFHCNLPTAEAPGKLKNRDDRRLVGTDKEKTLLNPAGDFYTGLGQVCVDVGCSVDLFLFPNSFVDVATLAEVPRISSGHMYKYSCFQADLQSEEFLSDLEWAVARPRAFNAVMRVRTSTGIRPVDFLGNCNLPNTTDIELASVDADTAVTVEVRHDDKLQDNDVAFIQVACLYSSLSGQRRIRLHNLAVATTSSIPEVFRIAELDTHMNWLGKWAVRALCSRAHPHVVDDLTNRVAQTLAAYRRHCSGGPGDVGASPGELVLPQNMKLYPLYVQCLMKTDAFSPADTVPVDERAWHMLMLNSMDVKQSNAYFYPRLYPVHNLAPNFEGQLVYPPAAIRCSYERLTPEGAYLLDNGIQLFLWLGPNLPAEWIQAVFNAPTARHFEPEKIYDLPEFDNETSQNLRYLIAQVHREHSRHARLNVIRPGDKLEIYFKRFMVEDRYSGNSVSYVEYLCHIHKEVCSLLR
ncbi:unnamed protein product [Calicophoron daubneyi]|uniref:Protein transport protein Sec24C n=1 Tax=Calicophoron daubneyi TaxID=300641 RepID=A0AAV2SX65_CALDB